MSKLKFWILFVKHTSRSKKSAKEKNEGSEIVLQHMGIKMSASLSYKANAEADL